MSPHRFLPSGAPLSVLSLPVRSLPAKAVMNVYSLINIFLIVALVFQFQSETLHPANTKHLYNIYTMLDQRRSDGTINNSFRLPWMIAGDLCVVLLIVAV